MNIFRIVVTVLAVALLLFSALSSFDSHGAMYAVLAPLCFLVSFAISRRPQECEDDPAFPFQSHAPLAARAPPVR